MEIKFLLASNWLCWLASDQPFVGLKRREEEEMMDAIFGLMLFDYIAQNQVLSLRKVHIFILAFNGF